MFGQFSSPRSWGRGLKGVVAEVDPGGNVIPVYPSYTQFGIDFSDTNSYPGTGSSVYSLDENGTVTQTGTVSGASFTTADSIPTFYFNGSATETTNSSGNASRITFPQFNFTSQVSFNLWVKLDPKLTMHTVIANAGAGGSQDGFKVCVNNWNSSNGRIQMETGNGSSSGGVSTVATGIVTQDGTTWHMLTYALSFADNIKRMWVDGVEYATQGIATPDAEMNKAWQIGSMTGNTYGMRGHLAQVSFWGGLVTSAEVQTLYNDTKSRYPGH